MKLLLSPTGTPPCPQSHSPASAGPHGPAPVPRMLREGARHRTRGCGRHAVGHHPGREGCSGWLTPPTPKSHLRPHKLIARLPALAAKPSQNSWLLILTRSGGTRRFTASTACSPRAVRKDSGPHSRPSSLFCSPETRTGCRGSWGSAGPGLGGGGGVRGATVHPQGRRGGPHLAPPPVLLEEFVVAGVAGVVQPEQPAGCQDAVGDGGAGRTRGAWGAQLAPRLPLLDLSLHHTGDDAVQDAGQAVVLGTGRGCKMQGGDPHQPTLATPQPYQRGGGGVGVSPPQDSRWARRARRGRRPCGPHPAPGTA